jgi:hypothetical protein
MKKDENGNTTETAIIFTADEANNLIQLINIAIKTEGVNVAKAGVYFHEKLISAFAPEPPKEEKKK